MKTTPLLTAALLPLALLAATGCDDASSSTVQATLETPAPQIDWSKAPAAAATPAPTRAGSGSEAVSAAASAGMAAPMKWPAPPEMKIDANKAYTATLTTNRGEIVLELFAKEAPKTVNNFVFLSREGFYDGVSFHRVIADFMIQGGDRNGNPPGTGDAGYKFEDEVDPAKNPHKFTKPGLLAMANAGPGTNGSQFFITHVPTPHLNGKHTIFGQVTKGQDIVTATQQGDTIKSVKIEEK